MERKTGISKDSVTERQRLRQRERERYHEREIRERVSIRNTHQGRHREGQ